MKSRMISGKKDKEIDNEKIAFNTAGNKELLIEYYLVEYEANSVRQYFSKIDSIYIKNKILLHIDYD